MGEIERITGSVVIASGIPDIEIGEVVEVGEEGLIGEVIRTGEKYFSVQVYESTSGVKPGEKVVATGRRLVAELGPGLISSILDGVGRPEDLIMKLKGPFITRGVKVNMIPRERKWRFTPKVKRGERVEPGDVIGEVRESSMVTHRIMIPHGVMGTLSDVGEGEFTVEEPIATVKTDSGEEVEVNMLQEWPVRIPRPFRSRLPLEAPLITGQRVLDTFFPVAKGGAAAVAGGFGTGKTITLHQLAKWCDAQIIVYIGCGERGNEMCELLTEFPELRDPRTGLPLMDRTILIANVSNMPVSAREASIYMGVTLAEYYRDMGYDALVVADSTSRWAEALREISGRLEEMPSERGYPAYLPDRIAEFYERAGRIVALGRPDRTGSITIVGAVSPPGGDFNEPVTIHTLRFTGVFWALDKELAFRRHFPAVSWLRSYSLYARELSSGWAKTFSHYAKELGEWWCRLAEEFPRYRERALDLLSKAAEIESIASIIGESALPDDQRLIMLEAEILREGFLVQNAFDEVDSFCPPDKQVCLLRLILEFYDKASKLIASGIPIERVMELPVVSRMMRVKEDRRGIEAIAELEREVDRELRELAKSYGLRLEVS